MKAISLPAAALSASCSGTSRSRNGLAVLPKRPHRSAAGLRVRAYKPDQDPGTDAKRKAEDLRRELQDLIPSGKGRVPTDEELRRALDPQSDVELRERLDAVFNKLRVGRVRFGTWMRGRPYRRALVAVVVLHSHVDYSMG